MTNADGKPKRGRPKQADASRKKIELAERRQQVADYVDQGLTLTTAAKRLGISETLARRDFAEWLKEGGPTPERDEMRAAFRRRYAVIAEKAALDVHVLRQAGDYDGAAKATGVILKAINHAAALLQNARTAEAGAVVSSAPASAAGVTAEVSFTSTSGLPCATHTRGRRAG